MVLPEADRHFARFVQSGDPDELGRVFDLTAPQLLVLAFHLTRLPHEAEDLVQSTFVSAIESASRFDTAQPVLPWLSGILANHAKRLLRRRASGPDAARMRRRIEPDPADVASSTELNAEVVAAVGAMPEPYRIVLLLRLVHGLDPVEIAHTLGHPLETVRTRLRRGIARLREVLPSGLSVSGFAGLDVRGLQSLREAVVAHAAGTPAPLALAMLGIGGLALMKKLVAVSLVLPALCTTTWFAAPVLVGAWGPTAAGPDHGDPSVAAPAPAAVADTATSVPDRTARVESKTAEPVAPPKPMPATLSGRCVAAESGTPLAGCVVTLTGRPSGDGSTLLVWDWGPKEWQELAPVTTGADGRFAFAFDPPHGFAVTASASADGRIRVAATWRWARDSKLDVGDVRLAPGTRVLGRIADTEGRQLAGVYVGASPSGTESEVTFGSAPADRPHRSATSAADGTFDLGWLNPGTWRLGAEGCRQLVEPAALVVSADQPRVDVTMIVRAHDPNATLAGVVVDSAGTPVPGTRIQATGGNCVPGIGHAGPDGRFRITCTGDPKQLVGLHAVPPKEQHELELLEPPRGAKFSWGTDGIRVVLGRSRPLSADIIVRDADSLRPVEEFGVVCRLDPRSARSPVPGSSRPRLLGRHPDGRLTVDDLVAGRHVLFVSPRREDLHLAGPIFFELSPEGTPAVEVLLHRKGKFRVRVLQGGGMPVAGTTVELLMPWGDPPPDERTSKVRKEHLFSVGGAPSLAVLIDAQTTGEDGTADLDAPIGQQGMALRLPGPLHHPKVLLGIQPRADGGPFDVMVDGGGRLTGRVTPADLVSRLARQAPPSVQGRLHAGLRLRRVGKPADRLPNPYLLAGYPVGDDGSFRIGGIPDGAWEVRLFWAAGQGSNDDLDPPLAVVTVREHEEQELELDARAWQPGRLRGQILLDGQPCARAEWQLRVMPASGQPLRVHGPATDDQGRFTLDTLLPVSHRLAVKVGNSPNGPKWLWAPEVFHIGPGEEADRVFSLRSRRVHLRLTASDGETPVADRDVWLRVHEGSNMSRLYPVRTDARGHVVLDPPPLLPAEVEIRSPDFKDSAGMTHAEEQRRTLRLGTIDDDPTATDLRVHLRLPAVAK